MTDPTPDEAGAPAGGGSGGRPPEPVDVRRYLPLAGLFVALWATLPQYSGPTLVTASSKEIADHIIPGVVVAVACLTALLVRPKAGAEGPGLTRFIAGMIVLLAGFWMVATHVPLLAQAFRDEAPWPATIYHSSSAFAVFGFGLLWTVFHWSDLAAMEALERKQAPSAG